MGETSDVNPTDDRIRFYCASHPTQVPIVTMHASRWAYCPGGYVAARDGHHWTPIEATSVYHLNPQTLLAEADAAMYEAKRAGKGRVASSGR
jgi:hypothetical protein